MLDQINLILLLLIGYYINSSTGNESLCLPQETCDKCLAVDYNCAWCTDKDFGGNFRCMTKADLVTAECMKSNIIENQAMLETMLNSTTQDYQNNGERAIQMQPQKLKMKLVKSHTQRFKMTYRPAKDNPLDLYYLMDLTWSMKDDKETLVKLGERLAGALQNLTVNYRLGFGSFADKPIMPMINPGSEKNPCAAEHEVCEPTYGFRHHLPLSTDIKKFVEKVNGSQVTGNLDNLEGGLDALMQVAVCPEEIGWSTEARKIVILVTDGFMHFAGDGLLAGITKRNDKKCHLNGMGEYEGTLVYDYPSLEEIYRELIKRKVSVIFAVTETVAKTYHQISDLMKEISNVEILRLDSSNILELIKKSYQSFIKRAQFGDNSPDFISVTYETDCGGLYKELRSRNVCNNIEIGKDFDFYINVTLKDFPPDGKYNQIIRIEEAGLSEFLEIEIELQPACPCNEESIPGYEGRVMCNDHGVFKCGMCICDEGWLGPACSCDSGNYTTVKAMETKCRPMLKETNELGAVCSNRGECECGSCYCNLGFTGPFCECPECRDCDPERSECYCGVCVCKYGWSESGRKCNCGDSTEGCIAANGEVCSKRGRCQCGTCECDGNYLGKFCEINSKYENKLCAYYEPCVKCLIDEELGAIDECENLTQLCSGTDGDPFEYSFTGEALDRDIQCLARITSKDGIKCDHHFIYDSDTSGMTSLKIQITDCIPPDYAKIGIGAFLATCLIGLCTLLAYKCIVTVKDNREYARFEKSMLDTKFTLESPIYKNPITKYVVPESISEDYDYLTN